MASPAAKLAVLALALALAPAPTRAEVNAMDFLAARLEDGS